MAKTTSSKAASAPTDDAAATAAATASTVNNTANSTSNSASTNASNSTAEMTAGAAAAFNVANEVPISMLYDLSLPVSIELGRTSMTVQEILRLGRNSVIQLDRLAGEPIDIYVGDRRFAEGEVVILGETFGVRITRLLSQTASTEELVS